MDPADRPAWAPTPADVAALLPARLPSGLTETSKPSTAQVQQIIDMLLPTFLAEVGTVGPEHEDQARTTLALGAASYIENSFIPEQSDGLDGPAEFFRRRYAEQLALLKARIAGMSPGGLSSSPRGSFPDPCPYPV